VIGSEVTGKVRECRRKGRTYLAWFEVERVPGEVGMTRKGGRRKLRHEETKEPSPTDQGAQVETIGSIPDSHRPGFRLKNELEPWVVLRLMRRRMQQSR
jgi:hypothetical protein